MAMQVLQPCVVAPKLVLFRELIEVKGHALIGFTVFVLVCLLMLDVLEDIDADRQELDNFY